MGLTSSVALILRANVTAPSGLFGVQTATMEWLSKPEPDNILDYSLHRIGKTEAPTGNPVKQEKQCSGK